jgi:Ca2+-binding EF-hand superfamily protein
MSLSINGYGSPAMSEMAQTMFKKLDSDQSGGVSQEEFAANFMKPPGKNNSSSGIDTADIFKKIDTDGDGSVSESELQSFVSQMPPPPGIPGPQGMDSVSLSRLSQDLLKSLDADNNGGISASELESALSSSGIQESDSSQTSIQDLFGKLDSNGDGTLDTSELETALKKSRQSMQGQMGSGQMPPPPPVINSDSSADSQSELTVNSSNRPTLDPTAMMLQMISQTYLSQSSDSSSSSGSSKIFV